MKSHLLCCGCIAVGLITAGHIAEAASQFKAPFAPAESYVKKPEQQFRHDLCLNGTWQFQPVALPLHFHEGTDPAPELPLPTADAWEKVGVKIPSTWNANSFASHNGDGGDFRTYPSYPQSWESVKMGWLRRTTRVPSEWKGSRILLHFAAVAGDVRVLVNGKDAGKTFDIFFPFDLDITDLIKPGEENEILVGVRKASLFDISGKYGRRPYQAGSFWGQHVVGIWQDVDLVAVSPVRVSDTFIQPEVDHDMLKVVVTLRNDTAAEVKATVGGTVHRWVSKAPAAGVDAPAPLWKLDDATDLALKGRSVTIPAHGEAAVTLEQPVKSVLQQWSPDHPNLYGLIVDVREGNALVDQKYQRFGWRQFKLSGDKVLLNGAPVTLRGDSWHFLGIPQMSRRYAWAWFTALHDAHLNAVRLHAEPYPEFYLDVADEMGIMVLDETAIWASDGGPKLDSTQFWADTNDHVAHLVMRDRDHPSVFGWSVANEVKPIVQSVFHGPPEMLQTLVDHYGIWAEICRKLDPTRQWISADGDDDGMGKLPTYMVHYGGTDAMSRAAKSGKPWGVGEASGAYYATPEFAAQFNGERAYQSFEGRMEGIAIEAYRNLLDQRQAGDDYRSVFNLVWYGIQPLPLGMNDTTKSPSSEDGVFFPAFVEGQPGVQPERLGPYSTTLNPEYDPKLPLYQPWPLFFAIKDANAEPPIALPWVNRESPSAKSAPSAVIKAAALIAGVGGHLREHLQQAGVSADMLTSTPSPELLFVDGRTPPASSSKQQLDQVLAAGGTVVVWGVQQSSLPQLNELLPASLELTARRSSSLLQTKPDPITSGLSPSSLYFSESSPPIVLEAGLDGPLVRQGTVLLQAANVDWLRWNKQPEYAKTASIVRSEKESKPSGAALLKVKAGAGRLLIVNLPAWSSVYKVQLMVRQILENLGLPLSPQVDIGQPFLKTGVLVRTLAAGYFPSKDSLLVDPNHAEAIRDNNRVQDLRWVSLVADSGVFHLNQQPLSNTASKGQAYLSFWLQSPRSLEDLLIEPNVPRLDLQIQTSDTLEVFLNGKSLFKGPAVDGRKVISGLPIHQGWNHVLIRLDHGAGEDSFAAKLSSSDPAYLSSLNSALQKP